MNEKLIYQLYETSIKMLEAIDLLSQNLNLINQQDYLNWKDKLNELSIDPNQ